MASHCAISIEKSNIENFENMISGDCWELLNNLGEEEISQLCCKLDSLLLQGAKSLRECVISDREVKADSSASIITIQPTLPGNFDTVVRDAEVKSLVKSFVDDVIHHSLIKLMEYKGNTQANQTVVEILVTKLTTEENEMLLKATDEELIKAAEMLIRNGILTRGHINDLFAKDQYFRDISV